MGAPTTIALAEFTLAEVRAVSSKCSDGAQVRRMLALTLVWEGRSRHVAGIV